MSLKDWSVTAASNTSAPPNGWPEGMTIANVNNTGREMMAALRNLAAEDTIASATTCDLGTKDATFLTITGTTTITGFGTVSAGIYKFVKFSGALTLTHNATSLILLTGANRTTVAGDCGFYKSEGSGNWREYFYSNQNDYQPLDETLTALAGALTAANKIPYATALNTLGELDFKDEDDMASNSATAIPSQQSVKAYVDAEIASVHASGTPQASTSGTAIDFTGIPSGTKRITVMLSGVSTNGSSGVSAQIGTSVGVESAGYAVGTSNGASSTTEFPLTGGSGAAAAIYHGSFTLSLIGSDVWAMSGVISRSDSSAAFSVAGSKTTSGTLDRVRIKSSNGTDAFDAGTINIIYE